ncbi:MAG: DUF4411 family protein [Acidimicrobiales bacterium]
MAYLLDTDVFIQAKNLHYGFDFCPAFWNWIDAEHAAGTLFSIERVQDELTAGGDDLDWARNHDREFFLPTEPEDLASLRVVSTWAYGAGYEASAVSIFLQAADYYLVAQAHASGHTVVTHEVPSPSTKKLKIPDACIGVDVKCVTPFHMLRAEHARFVLGPAA